VGPKDGRWFWNELRLAPMSIAGGEPTHYIELIRDVTANTAAEAQIAQSPLPTC
jgi:PAS domain S-box-containing protein